MALFGEGEREQLREYTDYEMLLFERIAQITGEPIHSECFRQGTVLRNDMDSTSIIVRAACAITGRRTLLQFIEEISPHLFVSAYKIIDMVVEWILVINAAAKGLPLAPKLPFSEKKNRIRDTSLQQPPLLGPDLRECLLSLYDNLAEYRHEVVHRREFQVVNGSLVMGTAQNQGPPRVALPPDALGGLWRAIVMMARTLIGDLAPGPYETAWVRYYLDKCAALHRLPQFGQREPRLECLVLLGLRSGDALAAKLHLAWKKIRDLQRTNPQLDYFFNLEVVGVPSDGEPILVWKFPVGSVPNDSELVLREGAYDEYRWHPSEEDARFYREFI